MPPPILHRFTFDDVAFQIAFEAWYRITYRPERGRRF